MNFGEKLKDLRIQKRLTLRDCAAILAVDASNWSKFERSITPAPKDLDILESWAEFFELKGEDKASFFDLAALSRKQIPGDIADDARVMQALPAFFRAVRDKELEGDKLKEFIEDLRKIHSPQPGSQG
jgi:transcriptional regulator with XRE-family HTH domain